MDGLIEGRELKKIYWLGRVQVWALNGVDFEINQGEFVVIAGPSGSGKTTLLNLCGLIDVPSSGQLWFAGEEVALKPEKQLMVLRKNKIGFVFQDFNLVPVLSSYENVEFPLLLLNEKGKVRRERVIKFLSKVGLQERQKHKPAQLSGGEQQRVAIARALVKQPALVIADEPTANLDSQTTTQIVQLMRQLNEEEGITFLIASHDPLVIDGARRVIRLRDGKVDSSHTQH